MSTYVPLAVQEGLDSARIARMRASSKLRIETSAGYLRVLRLWDNGFSIALEDAPQLRGYVDLFDGPSHLFQCLIVASGENAGEMTYEFKRLTAVSHTPPSDFARDTELPVALLEQSF